MSDLNDQEKATMEYGTRVRLGSLNVVEEAQGLLGRVVEPEEGFEATAILDNPHFNVVLMDDGRRIFMMDKQLEIVHEPSLPPAGSWADVARMMAAGDDSGFDWDAWKDEMKEGSL